jgi:hypothetical protein
MTTPLSTKPSIPGYTFGSAESAQSPLSAEDLIHLEQTVGWTADEEELLRKHAGLFESKAHQMVDSWRAIIGAQPHLAQWFVGPDGNPDDEYKARVKPRFVQWVIDVATRPHDRSWLNYQEEIGLRHTPEKKNKTDGRHTPPVVPLRYLLAFVPMVTDVRKFLETAISDPVEQAAVQRAWEKAVHLHIVFWTRPYTRDGLW